jgi:hypothetical protein
MTPWGWPLTWAMYQDSGFPGPGGFPYRGASGTTNDRAFGKDIPFFWSEVDLRGYRVTSRYLAETNAFAIGFMNLLVGYHVRKGYGWQVCRHGAKKTPYPTAHTAGDDPLVEKAQRVIDTFRDASHWPVMSREAFYRWRVDGEVFARIGWSPSKGIWARFVEPEQVGAPDGSTSDPWSYGIDVREYDDGSIDPLDVLAYHVWRLESGMTFGEWVDAAYIVHAKANVVANVKRGRPDFFPVLDLFDGVRKLYTNMLLTAVRQAAYAWLEKFPTASGADVRALVPQQAIGGGQTVPADASCGSWGAGAFGGIPWWLQRGGRNNEPPGTILRTEGNRQLEPMPADARAASFELVVKLAMRAARMRWNLPGSASGDAEDTTFAAAIQAGGPFPVAVEGSQLEWGACFERPCALRVLDRAVDAGLLTAAERAELDVEVTEPAVVTPEPDKDTTRRQTLNAAKVLSVTTWQLQEGLDPQHEAENFAAEARRGQAAGQQQVQPGPGQQPADTPFGESVVTEAAPGPPPRPGLVWNDSTHRWRNPKTGEEHEHPKGKGGKGGPVPAIATVTKSADGARTTTFAKGAPEAAAARLGPTIIGAMKELKFDIEFRDGLIPLGAIAQEVRATAPAATDAEIVAALAHMRTTRQVEGQPLNEVQKLEDPKSDVFPLGGGKNLDTATLWDNGKPIHYFLLPRSTTESRVTENFTGIDAHGHHWVNGKQVAAPPTSGAAAPEPGAPVSIPGHDRERARLTAPEKVTARPKTQKARDALAKDLKYAWTEARNALVAKYGTREINDRMSDEEQKAEYELFGALRVIASGNEHDGPHDLGPVSDPRYAGYYKGAVRALDRLRALAAARAESVVAESAPGPPPRPGLVWNDGTKRWRNPETGEEHEHPKAVPVARLARDPGADKKALRAFAAAAPSETAKETVLDAEHNVPPGDSQNVYTPDERRQYTVQRLGAAWRDAHQRGDGAGAAYAAEVLAHFGAELHGPPAGATTEFDGRYYDSDHSIASGPVRVVHPAVVLRYPDGGVHVATKGKVEPVS